MRARPSWPTRRSSRLRAFAPPVPHAGSCERIDTSSGRGPPGVIETVEGVGTGLEMVARTRFTTLAVKRLLDAL